MSDIEWSEASGSVIHLANELIRLYHPHLRDANIGFIFRSDEQKAAGKVVHAQVTKVQEKFKLRMDLDFLIWIDERYWERSDQRKRTALIDHELCHCARSDNDGWKIRPHDVEEFVDVIQRHGGWNETLMLFQQAQQPHQPQLVDMGSVRSVRPAEMAMAHE